MSTSDEHNLAFPDISLPIQVRHSVLSLLRFYVIPIMVFLVGSLLVTASTSASVSLPPIHTLVPLPLLENLAQNDPLNRAVQLALGLAIQAIGLYILKRDRE